MDFGLRTVKAAHTVVWAFFVASILAVPAFARAGRFGWAFLFAGIVMVEVLVLVLNGLRCPLTAVAARYTPDRKPNFDIYLPEWLARWNKEIFGSMYLVGLLYSLARWKGWVG